MEWNFPWGELLMMYLANGTENLNYHTEKTWIEAPHTSAHP